VKQHIANNSVVYHLRKQKAILHVVSYYKKKSKKTITNFTFFQDEIPFEEYTKCAHDITVEGKRARFTLLKDLRDKKLTKVEINKQAAVLDGENKNLMVRI
jgi:predicted RNA binding protein with dsRBD fold (UPF0201 family)